MNRGTLVLLSALTIATSATAQQEPRKYNLTPEQEKAIATYNSRLAKFQLFENPVNPSEVPVRPFSDMEPAGYLFMSANTSFESTEAKRLMAQHLPKDVRLVLYTAPGTSKESVLSAYEGVIEKERVSVVALSGSGSGFWSRDGLPVPTWSKLSVMGLVDARYFHSFEPDAEVAGWFKAALSKVSYYFEGGNFMPNDRGDCLIVDNRSAKEIPESVFRDVYGCKRMVRFPHEKGIGHVDETARFLKTNIVATDSESYAQILKQNGFEVEIIPRPNGSYETYVNSLIVNNVAYVPVYGQSNDEKALDVYRRHGYKVVPLESSTLSNSGKGSIHCITMTYPKVPFHQLLNQLKLKEL